MKRIEHTFRELKKKRSAALVGFVTLGDPDFDQSYAIILSMVKNGLDILELGFPFSDPAADGPVIQRSSRRALQRKVTMDALFSMTRKIRAVTDIPIIYMGYYNPVLAFGRSAFYKESVKAGADGVLIVDLPLEESDELTAFWDRDEALALIRMIAPTTPYERMKRIARSASGFLYLVSQNGVTGGKGLMVDAVKARIGILKSMTDLPVCTGFGISTPFHIRSLIPFADGIVIGSAFEQVIEKGPSPAKIIETIGKKTREFKAAAGMPLSSAL